MGRPQALINEDIRKCDYFLLMLWNMWGSPPDDPAKSPYTSGTEEEFHVAIACHDDPEHRLRQIVAFLKGVPAAQLPDPGPQLTRVLEFRRKLECERDLLYRSFDRASEFERCLRGLLAEWRRDHEDGTTAKATHAARSNSDAASGRRNLFSAGLLPEFRNAKGEAGAKKSSPQYDGNLDDDTWQDWYTKGANLREIEFWLS